jgi:hypothetical protein
MGGFALEHDSTKLAVLPTGFIYIIVSQASVGLRWSLSSDESDTNRVKLGLTNLIHSFPEMGNASTGCKQFLDWLSSM